MDGHLVIDREEEAVSWNGHVVGLIDRSGKNESVSLFVEPEDLTYEAGWTAKQRDAFLLDLPDVEDELRSIFVSVEHEPWPGRRGL